LSYAFVKFENRSSAQKAFDELNGLIIVEGCNLRLGWAHRNKSLHVGNCK
jgi:RNA recognition motif-containing protein